MATKVKGEAIKEGSIPLSALANEVKDKIENAGGKADWNAAEGENGYIKNKTHYRDYNLDAIPSIVNIPLLNEIGEYHIFKFNYIKLSEDWFNIENDTIRLLKPLIFKVDEPYSDEWNYDDYNNHNIPYKTSFGDEYLFNSDIGGDNAFIIYIHDNDIYKDGLYFDLGIVSTSARILKVKHLGVKTLDEEYLPDTILKTTPQTLSDADKNQALANLGINLFTNYKNLGGNIFDTPELYYKYKSVDRKIAKDFSYGFNYSGVINENLRVILIYGVIEDIITQIYLNEGVGNYGGDFENFNISYYNITNTRKFIITGDTYDDGYKYELSINIDNGVYELKHVGDV